jgi:signal transduction histidine kinase
MNWIAGIETLFYYTLPQTIIYTWFGFRFIGLEARNFLSRLALFSFITSCLVIVSLLTAPAVIHPILSIGIYALSVSIFFREFGWKYRLLLTVLMLVNVIIGEVLMVMVYTLFDDPSILRAGDPPLLGLVGAPGLLAVAAVAYLFQRFNYYPGKRVARFVQEAKQTPVLYFVLLISTQLIIFLIFMVSRYHALNETAAQWLLYLGILSILIVSFTAVRLIVRTRDEAIRVTQNAYVGDLMQVFTTIRGQRHDFINHVQVMYSMLTLNKQDSLKRYMEEVVSEIQAVSRMADQLPSTALGAFIQAKTAVAIDKKIKFDYTLPELPDKISTVRSVDLVRIIGNLIDNAFDEVTGLPISEREVSIRMALEDSCITIVVTNPGQPLSEDDQKRILSPGFSTKNGEHSGLGLPIVMERTRSYGGSLQIISDKSKGTVSFIVRLPIDAPPVVS